MTETDTPANDIPAILARANAATEGPWKYVRGVGYVYASDCITAPCRQNLRSGPFNSEQWGNDAEFIAHSRTDVPNMAAEILSLRAQLEKEMSDTASIAGWPADEGKRNLSDGDQTGQCAVHFRDDQCEITMHCVGGAGHPGEHHYHQMPGNNCVCRPVGSDFGYRRDTFRQVPLSSFQNPDGSEEIRNQKQLSNTSDARMPSGRFAAMAGRLVSRGRSLVVSRWPGTARA